MILSHLLFPFWLASNPVFADTLGCTLVGIATQHAVSCSEMVSLPLFVPGVGELTLTCTCKQSRPLPNDLLRMKLPKIILILRAGGVGLKRPKNVCE